MDSENADLMRTEGNWLPEPKGREMDEEKAMLVEGYKVSIRLEESTSVFY